MNESPSTGSQATGQVVGTLAGLAVGGPLGALVGVAVSPALIALAHRASGELRDLRVRSAAAMLDAAADQLGTDPERMVNDALTEISTAQHLSDALTAAANSLHQWKVEALAKALANGLADDGARVDEENLILRVLTDLEPVHVRALHSLRASGGVGYVAREVKASEISASVVISTLERLALVESNAAEREKRRANDLANNVKTQREADDRSKRMASSDGVRSQAPLVPFRDATSNQPIAWRITPFGRHCLDYLTSFPA